MSENITYTLLDYNQTQDLYSVGLTDDVIKIILRLENSYPLTFLEKESLRKKIDKLDIVFWIKNRYGFCEIVNQKLSEYIDSSPLQLEGNHEEVFFPVESRQVAKSLNNIVAETKKIVHASGLSLALKNRSKCSDLINIPIISEEDTVIAIISLSFDSQAEKKSEMVENYSREAQYLKKIPFASAILSTSGLILAINTKFHEFLGHLGLRLDNSLINEVFLPNFIKIYNNFISSDEAELKLNSSELIANQTESLSISLGKIFDKKHDIDSAILTINSSILIISADDQNNKFNMIENLIRNNPDAVLICDKENLKFIEVNEPATNLYGYRRDEMLEMDLTDLYSPEDIQLLSDSSSTNVREGTFQGPYKHRKKDGKIILVEMSRYHVKYKDREALFNVVRNITDKLEAEKRNQSFQSIFSYTDNLIFITDSSGFISFINQSVTKTLGYTKNDLMHSSFLSIVSDEDRNLVLHSLFDADKKDESSTDIILKSIDGRFLNVHAIATPVFDFNNEIESLTIIGKVRQSKSTLESEKLNEKKDDSEIKETGAGGIDSKFLKDLFHELLTPINVILGFAQDITESLPKPTPEQKEAAKIITENRVYLLNSMNTAFEYISVSEEDSNFLVAETKITDVIDQLLKDIEDSKGIIDAEFAYGKISSSLKFETDRQRFKYFLMLLFRIVAKLSTHKKIYFSAYAQDKDYFIVTFRDLQTHCSKQLVGNLKNIFELDENKQPENFGISKVMIKLAQKLLKILKGYYSITSEGIDKNDYGIVFPILFKSSQKIKIETKAAQVISEEKTKTKFDPTSDSAAKLRNELRIEALREKIRKIESLQKQKENEDDNEDIYEVSNDDGSIKNKIEYIDLDLQENSENEEEDETIEVIETTAPKDKVVQPPAHQNTDEKVDITNFSCLYFEDQIDSQILFSVQMKGLKNLNFAVSFEESLPMLESGNYDFIVIDINLQGSYNGLDILRIIRSMPKYENTPVFAVTAYVLPGDQQKFVLAGFNGFISKPIFRDQMIDLLAEVFNEPEQS